MPAYFVIAAIVANVFWPNVAERYIDAFNLFWNTDWSGVGVFWATFGITVLLQLVFGE